MSFSHCRLVWLLSLGLGCASSEPPKETGPGDLDGDRYPDGIDCDDEDPDVHPGAVELCDGIDNNCDERVDEDFAEDASLWFIDTDGDGYGSTVRTVRACTAPVDADGVRYAEVSGDCDDTSELVHPEAVEVCDGIDNNCDGAADEASAEDAPTWWLDSDGDGVPQNSTRTSCEFEGVGYDFVDGRVVFDEASDYSGAWIPEADDADDGWTVDDDFDCNDADADIAPGRIEVCDGKDNDCDGDDDNLAEDALVDDAETLNGYIWYLDSDGDGFGAVDAAIVACSQPEPEVDAGDTAESERLAVYVAQAGDCDDEAAYVNPAAPEVCDRERDGVFDIDGDGRGVDEDCDGQAEESDADGDPIGALQWFADVDGDLAVVAPDLTATVMGCAADGDGSDGSSRLLRVIAHAPSEEATFDEKVALYDPAHGFDCEDKDAAINPSATEVCDPGDVDENCNEMHDESTADDALIWYADGDGDGYGAGLGEAACPDNGTESDPSRAGFSTSDDDCDDADSDINTSATEVCDGVDNDCDGNTDEGVTTTFYADTDSDGEGDPAVTQDACAPPSGYVGNSDDCDDDDDAINTSATEVCDDVDNDCDTYIDDDDDVRYDSSTDSWYTDGDADGYGDDSEVAGTYLACTDPSGKAGFPTVVVANNTDCADEDPDINPDAYELCSTDVDDDCDGETNDASAIDAGVWYVDYDEDGYGTGTSVLGCPDDVGGEVRDGYALTNGDCNDERPDVSPGATEVCDGLDNDCDGLVDDDDSDVDRTGTIEGSEEGVTVYVDDDGDGVGREGASSMEFCDVPTGYATGEPTDCDDTDPLVNPDADELCDGGSVDEDCDGLSNESDKTDALGNAPLGGTSYFIDADGDGYGSDASVAVACSSDTVTESEDRYVEDGGDCDDDVDSGEDIHPGMVDVCNGVDDDCSGAIDDLGGVSLQKGVGELATDVSHCFESYTTYTATEEAAPLRAVTVDGDGAKGAVVGDTLLCTASYVALDTTAVSFVWSSDASNAIDGVLDGDPDSDGVASVTSEYVVTSDDLGSQIDCSVTLEPSSGESEDGVASIYVSDSDELSCDDVLKPATGIDTWTYAFCPTFDSGSGGTDSSDESVGAEYRDRSWFGNIAVQSGTVTLLKPEIASDADDTYDSWETAAVTLKGEGESSPVSLTSDSDSATLALEDLSLYGTVGDNNGGGLYCSGTHTVTLTDALFDLCTATNGGAIYVDGCDLTIAGESLISGSEAYESGGGVYVTGGGSVTLTNGSIESNGATQGGGVYLLEATMTVSGGSISANTADFGAGVYVQGTSSSLNMSDGTIGGAAYGNTAEEQGGGVYLGESAMIFLSGGAVTHNSAQNVSAAVDVGGGIHVSTTASEFPVSWSTVVEDNTVVDSGATNACDQIFDGASSPAGCLE